MKMLLIAVSALMVCSTAFAHEPAAPNAPGNVAASAGPQGVGVIKKLDMKAGSVTLQHGPIAALSWPAMTMSFKADPALLQGLKVGEKVDFTLKPGATPEVIAIKSAG